MSGWGWALAALGGGWLLLSGDDAPPKRAAPPKRTPPVGPPEPPADPLPTSGPPEAPARRISMEAVTEWAGDLADAVGIGVAVRTLRALIDDASVYAWNLHDVLTDTGRPADVAMLKSSAMRLEAVAEHSATAEETEYGGALLALVARNLLGVVVASLAARVDATTRAAVQEHAFGESDPSWDLPPTAWIESTREFFAEGKPEHVALGDMLKLPEGTWAT